MNALVLSGLLLAFVATLNSITASPVSSNRPGAYHLKGLKHMPLTEELAKERREKLKLSEHFNTLPHLRQHPKRHNKHSQKYMHKMSQKDAAATGTSSTIPLEEYYQYALIGNASIGTPAQNFQLEFDFWSPDLLVIAQGASVHSSEQSREDERVQYNANASSTYTADATGRKFSGYDYYATGVVVSDIVTLGGLSNNLTFGDVDYVGYSLSGTPVDGVIGLRDIRSYNNISNVLQQLKGSLDSPVITYHTNRSYSDYTVGDSEIVFGSSNVDFCKQDWVSSPVPADSWLPSFQLSSVSASTANGCQQSIASNHTLYIYNSFYPFYVSNQVLQLFVSVSGATFNQTAWGYQLPCDQAANAGNVLFTLDNGNSITIHPADYIVQDKNGICSLNVQGNYDENNSHYNGNQIVLGQQFLNNHCITYNIQDRTVGVATAAGVDQ